MENANNNDNGSSKDWTSVSFEEGRQTLQKWREENVRRSEEAVEIWEHVLSRHPSSLGDELWLILEQISISALDCGRLDVEGECEKRLASRFPNSRRVTKLHAMKLEAMEKYDEACEIYDELIKLDETNPTYRKRKIAILKAQRKGTEAITELCKYLKIFLSDNEAWLELSKMYLEVKDYGKAAHCLEELILAQPYNHLYHQRLGDIKYTQGGVECTEQAKQHFARALNLQPGHTRSLHGLLHCCNWLSQQRQFAAHRRRELAELALWAAEEIQQQYLHQKQSDSNNPNIQYSISAMDDMIASIKKTMPPASEKQQN